MKNSSMPVEDIEKWIHCGAKVVFNGPDEQLLGGLGLRALQAPSAGTYGAMPEVYLKIFELAKSGKDLDKARELQQDACQIIYKMCSGKGNMYAMIKEILRQTGGPDIGGVREPRWASMEGDKEIAKECVAMISAVKAKAVRQISYFRGDGFVPSPFVVPGEGTVIVSCFLRASIYILWIL